jgi:hypothetical protein
MLVYQTEAKPQGWRAVAVFDDRPDQLLYLNTSSSRVKAGVASVYFDLLDEDDRMHVRTLSLQRWHGAPDAGRWQHQNNIPIPLVAEKAPVEKELVEVG